MRTQFLPKILGYAFIEAENNPNQIILAFADWSKLRVSGEIFSELTDKLSEVKRGTDRLEIKCCNGSKIIVLPNKYDQNMIKGYRGHVVLIEGLEKDYSKDFIQDCICSVSCVMNSQFVSKISELCGDVMYSLSTETRLYFTGE